MWVVMHALWQLLHAQLLSVLRELIVYVFFNCTDLAFLDALPE
jgi:hypothetical protein